MTATVYERYQKVQGEHTDLLVMVLVGDYYEAYGATAEEIAKVIPVTVTSQEVREGERVAMVGLPAHSIEKYLAPLLESGKKVALCDDMPMGKDE